MHFKPFPAATDVTVAVAVVVTMVAVGVVHTTTVARESTQRSTYPNVLEDTG